MLAGRPSEPGSRLLILNVETERDWVLRLFSAALVDDLFEAPLIWESRCIWP